MNVKLKQTDDKIADYKAEENFKTVNENIKHLVDDTENLNCIKMWQLKKKIGTKTHDPPAAKKNQKGELVTEQSAIKQMYEDTYKKRLEHRKMKSELSNMYIMKMELFSLRFEVSRKIKSEHWS